MPPPPETPENPDVAATPPEAPADSSPEAPPPSSRRLVRLGAGIAALVVVSFWFLLPSDASPVAPVTDASAAMARAEWAAMKRRSPVTLGAAGVRDTLGPGDAERTDGRYADYYVFTARDSSVFSVVVASADFAPDLDVRRPDGVTVAGSSLLRTRTRSEVAGLRGPGRFEIVVTSRKPGETGVYELTAGPAPVADSLYADGDARSDTLGFGGATMRAGRFERIFSVVASSEDPVVIRVVSPSFLPRVELLGPTGEVAGEWRTLESVSSDTLSGVVLRYLPGWDAPYTLVVSSESPHARGPFAVDVRTLPVRAIEANGRDIAGTLGDDSWLAGYRYVDTYRFSIRDRMKTRVLLNSEVVAPAFRLYRQERRDDREAAADPNLLGEMSIETEQAFPAGDYLLEVTSGGEPTDTTRALGGDYTLSIRQTDIEPPPAAAPRPRAPSSAPEPSGSMETRVFGVSSERTGTSGGSTFSVRATQVAISYPGSRTRIQISVSVESVDYTGGWAPWGSFARKASLTDDAGRRYIASPAESSSPSGSEASPGTVRRGTVVFYARGAATGQQRLTFNASIGDRTLALPLSVP